MHGFKCLGAHFTETLPEIKASRCYFSLTKLLRTRALSKDSRVQLCCALLGPIVTYGRETRTRRKSEEYKLQTFGRKTLRRIPRSGALEKKNKIKNYNNYDGQDIGGGKKGRSVIKCWFELWRSYG